jgi:hypothetical protein
MKMHHCHFTRYYWPFTFRPNMIEVSNWRERERDKTSRLEREGFQIDLCISCFTHLFILTAIKVKSIISCSQIPSSSHECSRPLLSSCTTHGLALFCKHDHVDNLEIILLARANYTAGLDAVLMPMSLKWRHATSLLPRVCIYKV